MPDRLTCRHKVPVSGTRMMRLCGNGAEDTPIGPRCPHHAPDLPRTDHPQRTRAIISAKKLTLTRPERHELAEMLCGYSGTWSTIDEDCARRIADALEGFLIVQALLLRRQR